MIHNIRVLLWHIVAELEYILYPWKNENVSPPTQETITKYNLPEQSFDSYFQYDWLKSHDEKINKLEEDMIWIRKQLFELEKTNG